MNDDLIKRLPQVGELSFPMWQDQLAQYDLILKKQEELIKHLQREVSEEKNSRKVAADRVWEFADRIEKLEETLLDIFDHECRTSDKSFIACAARDALWPGKEGDKE